MWKKNKSEKKTQEQGNHTIVGVKKYTFHDAKLKKVQAPHDHLW